MIDMSPEKEDKNDIIEELPKKKEKLVDNAKLKTSKKSLILVGISIILIMVALIIILYFIFNTNVSEQNYIKAKFMIRNKDEYIIIFNPSFNDTIEKIKINDTQLGKIDNKIKFKELGIAEVELKFNKKLIKLDKFFL